VGFRIYALTNGNYVVSSPQWSFANLPNAGAATWGNGATGVPRGVVSAGNSLVGTRTGDLIGFGSTGVTVLSNGNYVISSPFWSDDIVNQVGAVTWGGGSTPTSGFISPANSVTGNKVNDFVGINGVYALTNGNYVVCSSLWGNGNIASAGAVTWLSGAVGSSGVVTAANSLVGASTGNRVGSGGAVALTNGNYVAISHLWDNGGLTDAGAVTWGPGGTGIKGVAITSGNSMVGGSENDQVGSAGVTRLTNGNFVVVSPLWDHGVHDNAGAVTWGNGNASITGLVSASNSLVGAEAFGYVGSDLDGFNHVVALSDGNYVVGSPLWSTDSGALTWGHGTLGTTKGAVSAANSLIGDHFSDRIGSLRNGAQVKVLSNGGYISIAPFWNTSIGAVTLGAAGGGTVGVVADANSVTSETAGGGPDLVAAYNTAWKQMVVGQPALNQVTLFSFPAPEVDVEQPVGTPVADGSSSDFGSVLTGKNTVLTFTVTNNSAAAITGLTLVKEGPNSAEFSVTGFPSSLNLAVGASATFTVKFAPTKPGNKTAYLHLSSGIRTQSSFDIVLTGIGITPILPVVKTLAATDVSYTTATLHGTVNAKGHPRDVTFDYGTSSAYGTELAANPPTLDTNVVTPAELAITGLLPHTKYHFRIKAAGPLGAANGANLTFTTLNHEPVAQNDPTYLILPGAKATLDVLTNDSDVDGDVLSIASFTKLSNPAAGKLTKTGTTLLFTASNTFAGPVTFSYTASDGFGKTATAMVTLNSGTLTSISPENKSMPSAAGDYDITVVATGIWSAIETLPWITVDPISQTGGGDVTVTLLPNAAKTARQGTIFIGGMAHVVTQAGVVIPSISAPVVPDAIVGNFYSLTIPTTGAPVTYTVTNMPAGLKMDNATGTISGIPTKGIPYNVKVTARNAAGPAPAAVEFTIDVKPVHAGSVGTFHGFIERDNDLNRNLGSRIELTTTALGTYTGKIITGATAQAIKGKLTTFPDDIEHAEISLIITRKAPLTNLTLTLDLDGPTDSIEGTLADGAAHIADVYGWRNTWNATNKASDYATLHTFSLEQATDDIALPQGYGYGYFKPAEATGKFTATGKLADGSKFLTASFVGPDGQVLIYQSLYTHKGSLAGILTVGTNGTAAENTVGLALGDSFDWMKPGPATPASKDTVYRDGFGPINLTPEGAAYVPIAKGQVVMGLPNDGDPDNAQLDFTEGELAPEFHINFDLLNPSPNGLTNKATLPTFASGLNPNNVTLPTVTPATGLFTGTFTLTAIPTNKTRKVTFQGLIVKHGATTKGYGYFLLPEFPDADGETVANTPKHSGRVILQAAP
jgi:hypothetical protein